MAILRAAFFLVAILSPVLHAAVTPWQSNPQGQVRLISPSTVAPNHGTLYFGLQFKTAPGWHVYWKNPGDAGYPPRLTWTVSTGFRRPELLWPAPHSYDLSGDLIAIGYTGEVVYPIRADVVGSPDHLHATAHLDYLTCEESCVPHQYDLTLDLPAGATEQPDPETAPLLQVFLKQVPEKPRAHPEFPVKSGLYKEDGELFFEIRLPAVSEQADIFFETNPLLIIGRPVRAREPDGNILLRTRVTVTPGQTLPNLINVSFTLARLGTGLPAGRQGTPFSLEQQQSYIIQNAEAPLTLPNQSATVQDQSTKYFAWVILLGFLGGMILNVMPCVLPVLSIKLLGLLQHSGEERRVIARDALASAAGIIVSFLAGGLIAIVAKAAGHAVGWGVQFQEPTFVALLGIIVALFALNLWGIFEIPMPAFLSRVGAAGPEDEGVVSFFVSGLFATLLATPCSAPFLGTAMGFALAQPTAGTLAIFLSAGVGMSTPYLALAAFPHSLHWLPKPGVWMLRVRVLMGFLLAATVLWLGYVLAAQVDTIGLSYFGLGLLALALLAWLQDILMTSPYYRFQWLIRAFAVLTIIVMIRGIQVHRSNAGARGPISTSLAWQPFDQEQIAADVHAGRSVFVDITADWCFTCKVNERAVLESDGIKRAFAEQKIVLMRGDWTNRSAVIGQFLESFHRYGIPFYVLYRPNKPPVVLSEFLTRRKVLDALSQ